MGKSGRSQIAKYLFLSLRKYGKFSSSLFADLEKAELETHQIIDLANACVWRDRETGHKRSEEPIQIEGKPSSIQIEGNPSPIRITGEPSENPLPCAEGVSKSFENMTLI